MIRTEQWELTRDSVLSESETTRLLGSLQRHSDDWAAKAHTSAALDEFIICALLFSGLRNSEFCKLRVLDVELSEDRPSFTVLEKNRARRVVYIPATLARLSDRFIRETRPRLLPPDVTPDDDSQPLAFNENHKPFDRNGLYRRVVGVLRRHGFGDKASVRLLRHSYGYLAYLHTGGNLLFVQRQLGHAHPRVTEIYAKLVEESYPQLANQVGQLAEPHTGTLKPAPSQVSAEFDCEID